MAVFSPFAVFRRTVIVRLPASMTSIVPVAVTISAVAGQGKQPTAAAASSNRIIHRIDSPSPIFAYFLMILQFGISRRTALSVV
ncbi:MAG TPA: hypothetical protein PK867_10935 [Pirellulales bacterium]|nr:hypothetical protein [Pirellulales bacterium]